MAVQNVENVTLRNLEEKDSVSMKEVDSSDGGGLLPPEFINQWNRLSTEGQKAFQDYLQHMSLFDSGTVQVNPGGDKEKTPNLKWEKTEPFALMAPETANTVKRVDKHKRDEQIEAVLEGIEFIHKRKLPRGLILNNENPMQTPIATKQEVEGCGKMADVLGKGNSAGEITVFKDRKSGQEMALKTVMISQFNANEIRLWVQLGDVGLSPELYHFELVGNKLYFTMEIMSGKDLQNVIDEDMWKIPDMDLARDFSLCILHDLLEIWEDMRSRQFVHADMHAGNLRLEKTMKVKIFDFGRAKNLLKEEKWDAQRLIKHDIVGIIRVFCALYSGFDFNGVFEAMKVLEAKNLKELDDCMIRISEESRKELYHIMSMLFDTVRVTKGRTRSESFGDTSDVGLHVKSLLSSTDTTEIKKRAAIIIFPERFQNKMECDGPIDSVDGTSFGQDSDPIWDDPNMEEFMCNVSDVDLRQLDLF